MKYFVSYTTRDKVITLDLLKLISYELKKSGEVFIDLIDNDSIDRQGRVMAEIDSSDIFILLETSNIYDSTWVTLEIKRASMKGIPIKILRVENISQLIENVKSTFV